MYLSLFNLGFFVNMKIISQLTNKDKETYFNVSSDC